MGCLFFLQRNIKKGNIYAKCKKPFYTLLLMPSLALYLCLCCQTDGEYKPIQKAAISKYGSVLYHIPDSPNLKITK